ncbi:alpha-galactosidase [Paenibacillus sophorae]|uniref:Alpha-galactosidase n=1 Tax=Paenibacillus sophorae TaxID=1333845 RepID=A0A1H8M4Y8_9BACL|nr:alpha-galactosidase [Paenibacillus sophorae]QWU17672.1 alpha-galactosidase [Paenibacillus sophorae]SEO12381.1 alpha-galactosidase [Paenibacillus sophorae]
MSIHYDETLKIFHLQTPGSSYVLQIIRDGHLSHRYWGARVETFGDSNPLVYMERPLSPNPYPHEKTSGFSLDTLPREYPGYGTSDFREPAFQFECEDGSAVVDLRYHSHRIFPGKPALEGLPATYTESDDEAETLELELRDDLTGLRALLLYTVFKRHDAIARSVRFVNDGGGRLKLLRAMSASVDFGDADYQMLHLSGGWANERNVLSRPLCKGWQSVESKRGASSAQHNPFLALLRGGAGEHSGEVYGFSLVYSGNFAAGAEVDQYDATRAAIGINPFEFSWLLEPGESFQTPEAVLVYSNLGLGGMSSIYHRLYRTRLARGTFRDRERPVLINNWEATYFDFDADKIEQLAVKAAELGIELLVLDDGWFGRRDDDSSSLGDWFVHKEKLPKGLGDLAERVKAKGLEFGLWFEPEMVNPDSELYRKHPDWAIHTAGRPSSTSRNQLVLDFSREEVCAAIVEMLSNVLRSAPISYVKWDMNRNMTEIGSAALPPERQRETAHRYILGLYRVLEELTKAFPDVLFESCASGGGRFDPGMLHYMPQTWTSDNTDAVSRLKIQYGTSIVYPASSMGAHVSSVPNHQTGRITPLETRGHAALSGVFGYELDLTALTAEEETIMKEQVALYKQIRRTVQFGEFHRLLSPFEGNEAAWIFVSEDGAEAAAFYYKILAHPNSGLRTLRLRGLDPSARYRVYGAEPAVDAAMADWTCGTAAGEASGSEVRKPAVYDGTGAAGNGFARIFGGDELMNIGLRVPAGLLKGDFLSHIWRLERVE